MDCKYVARGDTEEELWRDGTEHIIKVHGTEDADITHNLKRVINSTLSILNMF